MSEGSYGCGNLPVAAAVGAGRNHGLCCCHHSSPLTTVAATYPQVLRIVRRTIEGVAEIFALLRKRNISAVGSTDGLPILRLVPDYQEDTESAGDSAGVGTKHRIESFDT